jgi:hypothetical protein
MESQTTFSIEDIKTTGLDDLSVLARGLTPLLLEAWEDQGSAWPQLADAIALIDGWDYRGRIDSPVYGLFRLWVVDFYAWAQLRHLELPPVGRLARLTQRRCHRPDQATSFMMSSFGA